MTPQLLTLLCTGLCTGQGGREPDEPLPKPSLRAWPSSVAPPRSNVTLQCRSPTKDVHFTLRKGNIPLPFAQPPASTEGLAEFLLTDLRTSQAGKYTCEVHRGGLPSMKSPPSDAVLLLVTGDFSKPSLQAHRRGVVTAGDNVTLQCQRPGYDFRRVMFALLKAGEAAPIQTQVSVGKTDFSLWTVTAGDSGNYSCVYFQTEAPFWASEPSDPLEVRVRDSTERKSPEGAETGLAPALLRNLKNWGQAISLGKKAVDEASQASRAEEAHGVTYAELDIRALNEGPSSRTEQPPETCVYLTLKTQPGERLEPGNQELLTRDGWWRDPFPPISNEGLFPSSKNSFFK
ncbi:T-cell-interacting, activating receptor on myeloid cells protein 1-like isoform X2 [Suricata suricatta]|uniref:T-cell-interacting, activating receptor on myeloid cells protein 1-like isoform X2 n=1 Tax=Suricata suricatta TaxID=37032 RepID=UPI001155A158|nr:T-cell-interacting, activating receptor on myeloid cells protein 1-like isoform X2 [Suricata suricatta]